MKNTFLFALINMFSGMGYSLVSPLFPSLGEKDHLSEELLGWIISAYSIAGTILTPLVPKLIKKYSRINLLCFSAFFEALCTFLYGFLIYINSFSILISIIFLLRIIHGCCSAIIGTLVYSLTISLAEEDELQISLGNLEIAWSLGTSVGPLFASFCYNFGGYSLPFFVLGIFLFISVYIAKEVKSDKLNNENEADKEPSFGKFLIYPMIFLIIGGLIIVMVISSFYFPCLTNHLNENYGLTIRSSSLFFVVPTISYIFILQFLDSLTQKFGVYLIYISGLIISSLSSLFIFPCPPIPQSIILIIFGFLINGIGSAPVFIPGLVLLSKNIRKNDSTIDEFTANDISSAINNLTIDIGEFLGPIVGGFLTSRYNFKVCCYIIFVISISYSFIFFLYFFSYIKEDIYNYIDRKNKEKEKKDINEKEGNVDNDELIEDNVSSTSLVQFSSGLLGGFIFESVSKRRNSYANMFRKRRLSRVSLHSSLTE